MNLRESMTLIEGLLSTPEDAGGGPSGSTPTLAQRFKARAREIMPHQDKLQDLDDRIDDEGHIDEIIFRKSEYLGGMAAVILELVKRER